MRRLIPVARIRGVPVAVHWSVPVIGALIVLSALRRPVVTLVALAAYLAVLVVHELGHAVAARRRGCAVWSVDLYPIHGVTRISAPRSPWDAGVIAWGGVTAQALVAVPLVLWVLVFGYTRWEAANAVLALLGFFSLLVAVLNLLPVPHLDGPQAWALVGMALRRRRRRRR
jgi:Zn-dependent protease